MKKLFKNPLEVKENDTLGTAVLKGMTDGFIKGTLASAVGLGVTALVVMGISKKVESKKDEEELEEQMEKDWEVIKSRIDERIEKDKVTV